MTEISPSHTGPRRDLCQSCLRLNIEDLTSAEGQLHLQSGSEAHACPLCEMLFSMKRGTSKETKYRERRLKLFKEISNSGTSSTGLHVIDGANYEYTWATLVTDPDDVAATKYGVGTYRMLTSSGSKDTMNVIRGWLDHCLAHHSCASSLPGVAKVVENTDTAQNEVRRHISPTRLIDTNAFGADWLDVRLVDNPGTEAKYATLSHCWGAAPEPKYQTTIETLARHHTRIRWHDLPRTFRDAVSICRNLDIRYLWIDSLCIIQNSQDERNYEIASMADVYGNSYLTISADWSPAPEGGCFTRREEPEGLRKDGKALFCVTNTLSDGSRSSLYFPKYYKPDHQHLDNTHLAGRAWAYQERSLSRRNLHFTRHQLFWECRSAFAGEDLVPRSPGQLRPSYTFRLESADTETKLHIWYFWMITRVTSGELTLPTDRLPAVSALARIFQHYLQTPYLAGLWLEGLWYGLSWYRHGGGLGRPRWKERIAPTWSWAAVNHSVNWLIQLPSLRTTKLVEVVEVGPDNDPDPSSLAPDAWIRLSGQVVQDVFISNPKQLDVDWDNITSMKSEDLVHIIRHMDMKNERSSEFYQFESPFLDSIYLDFQEEPALEKVDCLLLGEERQAAEEDSSQPSENNQYFLLLRRTGLNDGDIYERVGVATRKVRDSDHQWVQRTVTII